jgi:hypothetical protein
MEVASSGMAGFEFLRGLFVPKAAAANGASKLSDPEPGAVAAKDVGTNG